MIPWCSSFVQSQRLAAPSSSSVPMMPEQIADSRSRERDSVVHLHVRDPEAEQGSQNPALFRKVQRIRKSDVNPMINLTAGAGGDLTLVGSDSPLPPYRVGTDIPAH